MAYEDVPADVLQEMQPEPASSPATSVADPLTAPMQGSAQQPALTPTSPTAPTVPTGTSPVETPAVPVPATPSKSAPKSMHEQMMDVLQEIESTQIPAEQAKEANLQGNIESQTRALAPHLFEDKKDFWQNLTEPIGTSIYRGVTGFAGGLINTADQAKAAIESANRAAGMQPIVSGVMAANALSPAAAQPAPAQPYQSLETAYEQSLEPGTTDTKEYQGAKTGGEIASYAAVPIGGEMAAGIKGAAAMGGLFGGLSENQRAMKETGQPPTLGQLAGSSALGAGLGVAGHGLVTGAGKLIGGVAKNFAKKAPEAAGGASGAATEATGGSETPAAAAAKSEPIEGKFRYTTTKKGHEQLEKGLSLEDFVPYLTKEEHDELKKVIHDLVQSLVSLRYFQKARNIFAANALKLAVKESEKDLINAVSKPRLSSEGAKIAAMKKTALYTKQVQALKAKAQQDIKVIQAQLAGAEGAARSKMQRQLAELERMHREQLVPKDVFDIPTGKHIHGQADLTNINPEPALANTFDAAHEQAAEAQKTVNDLQTQYDKLKGEVQHILEAAEKKWQEATGKREPFHMVFKHEITSNGGNTNVLRAAISLRHDPWTAKLIGMYKKEYDACMEVLRKHFEKTDTTYDVNTGKPAGGAAKRLEAMGMLTDTGRKIMLSALAGTAAYLDFQPAEAATSEKESHMRTGISIVGNGALALGILILIGPKRARVAVNIVKQFLHDPHIIFATGYRLTKETIREGDNLLVKHGLLKPNKSLAYRMDMIAARIYDGMTFVPEKGQQFIDAIFHGGDSTGFSPVGEALVGEIRQSIGDMRKDIPDYVKQLQKFSQQNPDSATITNCLEAAEFVKNTFFPDTEGPTDWFFRNLGVNAPRVWFTANPKNMLGQVFDLAIAGPLQLGPKAMANAYRLLITKNELRELVGQMYSTGAASQQVTGASPLLTKGEEALEKEAAKKAAPSAHFITDRFNASVGTLASLLHYFDTHPEAMKALGIKSSEEFATKLLSAGIQDEGVRTEAFIKLVNDLAALTGHDWFRINVPPLLRSKYIRYGEGLVSQVSRFATLMAKAAMEKNWTGLAATLFVLQQVAGPAAIPKSLQGLAWYASPDNFAKFQEFMRMLSLGEHLYGNLESLVDYDPLLFPLLGVDRPGVEMIRDAIGDLPATIAKVNEVHYDAALHAKRFVGDPGAEVNLKAQKALHAVLTDFAYLGQGLTGLPLGRLPPLVYGIPQFLHKEFEVAPPKNILGQQKGAAKLERYGDHGKGKLTDAQQDAVRYASGLPERMEVANYKTAKYGLGQANLTGRQEAELNKMISRSGIPK
jgi:hypothetical protein